MCASHFGDPHLFPLVGLTCQVVRRAPIQSWWPRASRKRHSHKPCGGLRSTAKASYCCEPDHRSIITGTCAWYICDTCPTRLGVTCCLRFFACRRVPADRAAVLGDLIGAAKTRPLEGRPGRAGSFGPASCGRPHGDSLLPLIVQFWVGGMISLHWVLADRCIRILYL